MNMLYIIFILLFADGKPLQMSLDSNNKFQDILIYLNDNIPQNDGLLIDQIKDYFNKASMSLWKATSKMDPKKSGVQFGTVYILVPSSWTISSNPITWQQCNKASFFVTVNNENSNIKPITKQLGKCGEPGEFTRLPVSFFQSKSINRTIQAGKEIMNEFIKLRYGVFSEQPLDNVLMVFNGTGFINAACGHEIELEMNKDKMECAEPNANCRYSIIRNQHHDYSVTFDTETHESEFYCDNDKRPHNKYAKSLHNIKCNRRSITDVILDHPDFAIDKQSIPFENTHFVIVKKESRKIVLVLDTSLSMAGIIDNMKKATVKFLETVEDSAHIGIVDFNSNGRLLSQLLSMHITNNRNTLINIINGLQATSNTNIPDGLVKGVKVLGGDISNTKKIFGTIILLTDGYNNNETPYSYEYVINQIIKKGILINSIAYGNAADSKINRLTRETGGKYFFVDPNTVYLDLFGKLSIEPPCDISVDNEKKIIKDNLEISISESPQIVNVLYIDEYIGMNLKLTISIPKDKINYQYTLILPSGEERQSTERVSQVAGITLVFSIPGKVQAGVYSIKLVDSGQIKFTDTFSFTFTVSAKLDPLTSRIIVPTGKLSESEIKVIQDSSTILAVVDLAMCGLLKNENITVTLFMRSNNGRIIVKTMNDDGLGEDAIAGDEIYSVNLYAKDFEISGYFDFYANVEIIGGKGAIKRSVEIGSLRVDGRQINTFKDRIPPARIENIVLKIFSIDDKILQIRFIAPGNDGMDGLINVYEIMINFSKVVIEKRTSNVPPRQTVELYLDLKQYDITEAFEVSVRGVDDNNNTAEWSPMEVYHWNYEKIFDKSCDNKHWCRQFVISVAVIFISIIILIEYLWFKY